jgi:hypothetical protein
VDPRSTGRTLIAVEAEQRAPMSTKGFLQSHACPGVA